MSLVRVEVALSIKNVMDASVYAKFKLMFKMVTEKWYGPNFLGS